MGIVISGNKNLKFIKAVYYQPVILPSFENYLTIEPLEDNFQIQFYNECNAQYSLNEGPWIPFEDDYMSPIMNIGDKLYVKGELEQGYSCGQFYTEQSFNVSGNCNSLIFGDNAHLHDDLTGYDGCYAYMFEGCSSLVTAPELPATTLAESCYYGMFQNCSSLVTAPELPATTLAESCYYSMFYGCSSLVTAPALPATALVDSCYTYMFSWSTSLTQAPELPAIDLSYGCYSSMFEGCSSLVTAPALPATTLAEYCYESMFLNCSSLVTAPELPATTLAKYCYSYMFQCCTSLVSAPVLPAITLKPSCYSSMFMDCTSLVSAPELPATTLVDSCYSYMFEGCSKLNYIKALFTTKPSSIYTDWWVSGVSSTGTFVKNPDATWNVTGVNGIPSGWTVQTA
jgi:hypothetical protein